jgi:hypothetical protein
VGVNRYIDGTVGGENFQKFGHIEGSLNFPIFALSDDGLPCDRLLDGQLRGSNQEQSRWSAHVHRNWSICRLENE